MKKKDNEEVPVVATCPAIPFVIGIRISED